MNYWLMATGAIHGSDMQAPLKGMPIGHPVQRNNDVRIYDRVYLFMWNVGVFGWGPIDEIRANSEQLQGNEMQTVVVPASEIGQSLAPISEMMNMPEFTGIMNRFSGNFVALTPQMVNSLHGLIRRNGGRCPPDVSEIEEKRNRILEDHGILLSFRYLDQDLHDAFGKPANVSVAVIYADMDDFGPINKTYGHDAGDAVMKAYLTAVRDAVGDIGTAYRGVGDETVSIIIGQNREQVSIIANDICQRVRSLKIEYKGNTLPKVTASVGVAISPPGPRSQELQTLADERQREAKKQGKNQVIEN